MQFTGAISNNDTVVILGKAYAIQGFDTEYAAGVGGDMATYADTCKLAGSGIGVIGFASHGMQRH